MKTTKVTLILAVSTLSLATHAQVLLTGLLQQGTSANGQTAGSPIWNTLGNEISFANIYLTQPNAGYTAPLLNSGNGADASISVALTPGSYQFYYFVMGFWDNNPGYYGLNLFFDGNATQPGISAYSPANTDTATSVTAGLATLSLDGDNNNQVPAPGSLIYTADGLNITLTDYGFGAPGVFGGPALDRVNNLSSNPDGYLDSVGVFTLTVASVPEPSPIGLIAIATLVLVCFKSRLSSSCHLKRSHKMKTFRITVILAILTASLAASQAQSWLTNGLVAYYPFNGNANDASGNGYNGTPYNVTNALGYNQAPNNSYGFDGQTSIVLANNGPSFNHPRSAQYGRVRKSNFLSMMRPDPAWRIGTDADDGGGIRLGLGVGGAPLRLEVFECALPLGPPHRLCRAILVDRTGRRFVNEDTYTGRIGWKALMEHDGDVFMVLDESIYERNLLGLRFAYAAETVEELARDMDVPEAALAATVANYNEHAINGEDPEFGKLPPFVQPLVPPLGAIDLGMERGAIYATFTLGGLHADVDGRVLTRAALSTGGCAKAISYQ